MSDLDSAGSPLVVSQCLISFGSNLGNRHDLIAEAARSISKSDMVLRGQGASFKTTRFKTSRLFETPPIGGPGGQEPFLNAVAAFETDATAREVLARLQSIENQLGRLRRRRWDARTIDLDVVLHGQLVGGTEALTVPHPRYTARQFVLQPACDVAPDYCDPRFGWSLRSLADHLSAAVASLALVGAETETRQLICNRLASEHGVRTFAAGDASQPGTCSDNTPWVTPDLPELPHLDRGTQRSMPESSRHPWVPRLVVRMQRNAKGGNQSDGDEKDTNGESWAETHWPAPHQIWPAGWRWPEYRLVIDDLDWAVGELASALDSMQCPVAAITQDGQWW